jgi:hypothetical protein
MKRGSARRRQLGRQLRRSRDDSLAMMKRLGTPRRPPPCLRFVISCFADPSLILSLALALRQQTSGFVEQEHQTQHDPQAPIAGSSSSRPIEPHARSLPMPIPGNPSGFPLRLPPIIGASGSLPVQPVDASYEAVSPVQAVLWQSLARFRGVGALFTMIPRGVSVSPPFYPWIS